MEILFALIVGTLTAGGVYLTLRAWSFAVVLGYALISYAVNLLVFASGGLTRDAAPLVRDGIRDTPDPLPQALVLTAIVIGLAMTAFVLVQALRSYVDCGSDHVDGGDGPGQRR